MEDKVALTLACLNIKKLVKMMVGKTRYFIQIPQYYWIMGELSVNIKKANIVFDVCLHCFTKTTSCASGSEKLLAMYQKSPPKVLY